MINIMNFFERIISKPTNRFSVGQKIHSVKTKKVLNLKREIYVNEIKHFSACIENSPIKNTVILSERALNDELYIVVDKAKNYRTRSKNPF